MSELLARDYSWTERQRQVLDLLAAGKSNQEIADELGISLDGAKYHMREILGKLGVDTREEAAEYWRRHNAMPSRLGRVFRGVSVGGVGLRYVAAATAVVVVLVVGGAFLFLRSEDDEPPKSGLFVAVPGSLDAPGIRILDVDRGTERVIGGNRNFVFAAWSPDGSHLAATTMDPAFGSTLELVIFERINWKEHRVEPGGLLHWVDWSPTSDVLAVRDGGHLTFIDADGKELARTDEVPALSDGRTSGSGANWSPDGQWLSVEINNELLLIDRNGRMVELTPPGVTPGAQYQAWYWESPTELMLVGGVPSSPGRQAFRVRVGDELEWEPLDFSNLAPPSPPPIDLRDLAARHPGYDAPRTDRTADGRWMYLLRKAGQETERTSDGVLIIDVDGQERLVELRLPWAFTPGRALSVVVVQ